MISFFVAALMVVTNYQSVAKSNLPKGDEILKRCLVSYDNAKTFQGEIKWDIGATPPIQIIVNTKVENDGKGNVLRGVMSVQMSGAQSTHVQTIEDQMTDMYIDLDKKQFQKRAHGPDKVSGLLNRTFANVMKFVGKFKVTVVSLNNRPTYKLYGDDGRITSTFWIDKQTYHFLSFSAVPRKESKQGKTEVRMVYQKFDEPIPDSTFSMTPPNGVTEMPSTPAPTQ